jgi:ATP-dependent protease ClpP protease subunit
LALMKLEKAFGTKLVCVVLSDAHSMAFNLLTHCDRRLAVAGSKMLVHKARVQIFFFGIVRAKELKELVDALEKVDAPFRRDNSRAMGLSLREYDRYADAETMWQAETLLKRKYLHGILDSVPLL